MQEAWEGFKEGIWTGEVDVRDFIQKNYTPYEGDESFLAGPTERTKELWGEVLDLLLKEREQGGENRDQWFRIHGSGVICR